MTERVQACSKMFELPKFKIEALLHGVALDIMTMQKIADELEVSTDGYLELLKKKQNTNPKISRRLGHFDPTKLLNHGISKSNRTRSGLFLYIEFKK
ncbi:hypothetical protein Ltuc_2005 [Legionella tucsonensis]|uniref:Uncharacterized protein n=1 Tax=Legionella tucsonensis TaxID=40335 RepID=A0A0W0ZYI9_9GAMM|nr:hypothetical protein [Legionella tucsonensis]KTD74158.1 hypothetical protein Ltuc_2005 [Legionella tucsonensis]